MNEYEEIYREMEKEFERNHPLLMEMYEKYKTFQDISDEWREIRKPISIVRTSNGTRVIEEAEG